MPADRLLPADRREAQATPQLSVCVHWGKAGCVSRTLQAGRLASAKSHHHAPPVMALDAELKLCKYRALCNFFHWVLIGANRLD